MKYICGFRRGFTLAEVLITLGIIGVVAACTLPALINATQGKELHTALLKSYSILQQAVQRMAYEEGVAVTWTNYPDKTFAPVFKKYLKMLNSCGKLNCSSSDIKPSQIYKTYNKKSSPYNDWFDEGQSILADGMFIMINNSFIKEHGIIISVDVNGINKKPNLLGHDVFSFEVYGLKVIPLGSPEQKVSSFDGEEDIWFSSDGFPCDINSTNKNNGMGCTYRALTEKDYFNNLP